MASSLPATWPAACQRRGQQPASDVASSLPATWPAACQRRGQQPAVWVRSAAQHMRTPRHRGPLRLELELRTYGRQGHDCSRKYPKY